MVTHKNLLCPCSEPISLPPNFKFQLKVSESLSNQFHIKNTRHALLCLAERLEFVLQDRKLELDIVSGTFFARTHTICPIAANSFTKVFKIAAQDVHIDTTSPLFVLERGVVFTTSRIVSGKPTLRLGGLVLFSKITVCLV